jgi:hypothetical protein
VLCFADFFFAPPSPEPERDDEKFAARWAKEEEEGREVVTRALGGPKGAPELRTKGPKLGGSRSARAARREEREKERDKGGEARKR